ncbi:hypothetical protein WISP_13216 [Willisornis vidua]|uniref:Uncharacterized protein n=1 Tax=Willisornis vidua TaxID=1566151 RepID=A0ABQ9DW21_9PASS|nr:hypothetical protein WISP_13216 [Willisornis vidua]
MWSHQYQVEDTSSHFSSPAGHSIPDNAKVPLAFLTAKTHYWLMFNLVFITNPVSFSTKLMLYLLQNLYYETEMNQEELSKSLYDKTKCKKKINLFVYTELYVSIMKITQVPQIISRPPSQDNGVKEFLFEELRDTSKSTALILMGDFYLPEVTWEHHTAGTTWARRFLKNLGDNFMEQVLRKLTQKDAPLDLLLVKREEFMSQVKIGGHLGHSNHKVIKFKISVERRKSASKTSALDMKKADFRLLREFMNEGSRGSQYSELEHHDCENDQFPNHPEIVWDLLLQLDPYKSMGPDGIHPRILKMLADAIAL